MRSILLFVILALSCAVPLTTETSTTETETDQLLENNSSFEENRDFDALTDSELFKLLKDSGFSDEEIYDVLERRIAQKLKDDPDFAASLLGDKGDKGDPGENGIDGLAGTNGLDGINGRDGVDGTNGIDGFSCWDLNNNFVRDLFEDINGDGTADISDCHGMDGLNGTNGKDGINGTNGRDGLNGKDGTNGTNGRDGADGVDGLNGLNGKDGTNGLNGAKGADGVNGKDGINGLDGANGVNGLNGKDGIIGQNGTNGLNGINGQPGLNGEDGYSCWDTNTNHVQDVSEDTNNDGVISVGDCSSPSPSSEIVGVPALFRDLYDENGNHVFRNLQQITDSQFGGFWLAEHIETGYTVLMSGGTYPTGVAVFKIVTIDVTSSRFLPDYTLGEVFISLDFWKGILQYVIIPDPYISGKEMPNRLMLNYVVITGIQNINGIWTTTSSWLTLGYFGYTGTAYKQKVIGIEVTFDHNTKYYIEQP